MIAALDDAQVRPALAGVDERALHVRIEGADRELVARREVALELRRRPAAPCPSAPAGLQKRRCPDAGVDSVGQLVIGCEVTGSAMPQKSSVSSESMNATPPRARARRHRPVDVRLDAVDARLLAFVDDRQAVLAEERELEVVPVLREQRAVPAQAVARPRRLPADLVVREDSPSRTAGTCRGD